MKTITTKLFAFSELSDEAKQVAIESRRKDGADLDHVYEMMHDSVAAVTAALGLRVMDYAEGSCCQNYKLAVSGHAADLSGNKALAKLLNVLLAHGYSRPATFAAMAFPGICGFTGVCFDEDVVETVWQSLLDGEDMAAAFDAVAYKFCQYCETEETYLLSDEAIVKSLSEDEIFEESGEIF